MNILNKTFFPVIFFSFFIELFSLPRFAVRLGDQCSDCHINPTGGMIRNENGWFYGKYPLSMISPREQDLKLSPQLTDNINIGLDLRGQFLYSQEISRTDFQDMSGAIYTGIKLSEKIDVAAKYDFVTSVWEAFAIARVLPLNGYVKGGTFQPYTGLRIDDHTSYTRGGDFSLISSAGKKGLPFDPYYKQSGVELGFNIDDIAFVTASVGRPNTNYIFESDPTYIARFELTPLFGKLGLLFGGFYLNAKTKTFTQNFATVFLNTNMYGGFFGIGFDKFALLGEYDFANDYLLKDVKTTAMMAELSYQILVGLEAVVRYDRFDPNSEIEKDELAHVILGFEFFPFSFVEVRPQYRMYLEDPSKKNNAFVFQFHIWY